MDKYIVALAHSMADVAGEIQKHYWRRPHTVDRKADASPVTLADRETEMAMRTLIEANYPEHGIIGEEFGKLRETAPMQWVLDPIDGTRSFIGGYPLFTSLISLVDNGVPVLGVIDQPVFPSERWFGMHGEQSTLNNQPIKTRDITDISQAVIATTSIDYFSAGETKAFHALRRQCGNCVLGGDAYAYAMLASGHIDIVADAGLKAYDFCALRPIIEGAGGIITDWAGDPVTLHTGGRIVASANAALHREALTALQSAA